MYCYGQMRFPTYWLIDMQYVIQLFLHSISAMQLKLLGALMFFFSNHDGIKRLSNLLHLERYNVV